jgi:hypothetical protein
MAQLLSVIVGSSTPSSFSIGTSTAPDDSQLSFGSESSAIQGVVANRTTLSTTAATSVVGIDTTVYRSAKVQVQIVQGSAYQASDVLLIHDGSSSNLIEYGTIATGDYLADFSTDISGGDARLLVTMGSATSATVKTITQKITV